MSGQVVYDVAWIASWKTRTYWTNLNTTTKSSEKVRETNDSYLQQKADSSAIVYT